MAGVVSEELRRAIAAAVKEGEAKTSAELVVVVRAHSGTYRDVHYAFGFAFALATLVALLYLPTEFPLWLFGVDIIVGFIVGSLIAAVVAPLARALATTKRLDAQVDQAAHAAFFERSVSRTSARTGVLLFVSLFEQRVRVLPDIGIHVEEMGEAWKGAILAAAEGARDPQVIPAGLRALAVALAAQHPRTEGDTNELPDEPSTEEAG
jgi:putative membrane protein